MNNAEAVNWLINITADIGKIEHQDLWHYEQALSEIREILEDTSTIKPETGRWIKEDRGHVEYTGICNKCGFDWGWYDTQKYFNFCPNCGERMERTNDQ